MKKTLGLALGIVALLTGDARGDASASCRPNFLSAQSYAMSGSGVTVSTADLNGDGLPDLTTTGNNYYAGISVRLGNPDGTFGAQIKKTTNFQTLSAVVGAFTNDPAPDAVLSTYGNLYFFKGNGDGTFQDPVAFGSVSVGSMTAADMNGDGKLDLVGFDYYASAIYVFPGNGDGTFQSPVVTTPKVALVGFAVGDVNGDGKLDLVASSQQDSLFVYLGLGDGSFAPPTAVVAGSGLGVVALADVNGDGHLDVLVTSSVSYSVAVLLGNGDGTFQAALNYGSGPLPLNLLVADFDGDGALDIASLSGSGYYGGSGAVEILQNLGNGTFASRALYLGVGYPSSAAAADFGNDGHVDITLGDGQNSAALVLRGNGDGTFEAVAVTPTVNQPASLTAGDFNEDGILDVVIGSSNGDQTYLATGGGRFTAGAVTSTNGTPLATAAGDFNGDGHLDLAVLLNYGATVEIHLGNGDGTFGPATTYSVGPYGYSEGLAVGDFDGDGILDLAVLRADYNNNGFLDVLLGAGDGNFGTPVETALSQIGTEVLAADFNGDGRADLAIVNPYPSGVLDILIAASGGLFQPSVPYPIVGGSRGMTAADLRHSGHLDLVVGSPSNNTLALFPGNGDGSFGTPAIIGIGASAYDVAAADVNGDGNLDLVTANPTSASVLLGLGTGAFQSPVEYSVGSPFALALGDFTGSGRPDATFGNANTPTGLTVLLNGELGAAVPNVTTLVGSPAVLRAFASGYGALTYQWRKNGTPIADGGRISGATTATLTIDPAGFTDAGSYDVLVTDSCGGATSSPGTLSVEFADVPPSNIFHDDIITIATAGVTVGCGGGNYCPTSFVTRAQMAPFLLRSEHGSGYGPPACTGIFTDVPCPSPSADWIEQLSNEGITAGCGGGNYCPDASITRAQMAVFLLKTKLGSVYVPPAWTPVFGDVPSGAFAAAWINDLYNRAIAGGCSASPLLYCPDNPVNRGQMAAFLVNTFF